MPSIHNAERIIRTKSSFTKGLKRSSWNLPAEWEQSLWWPKDEGQRHALGRLAFAAAAAEWLMLQLSRDTRNDSRGSRKNRAI